MLIHIPILLLLVSLSAQLTAPPPIELELVCALPVEGAREPSGMTIRDNRLFVVSDNDDQTIYELKTGETVAVLRPHVRFTAPASEGVGKLDFEGISHDKKGDFYLVSESTSRVLHVSPDGRKAEWVTPDMYEVGWKKGLFQINNGGLEGIACISPRQFFLCAERQARGILKVTLRGRRTETQVWNCDERDWDSPYGRPPDFSDLYLEKDRLFALMRSDEGVAEMRQDGERFRAKQFWSFGRTLRDPAYSYRDATYGKAEGLCMDRKRVYLILDNNTDTRSNNDQDARPLFFIFKRPN
ncbi:MAG: esterase-like activity of phytase family protein [Acidobacteriota bacterium]